MEQPLQNETSEDKTMHDQVGQSDFENLDEDQITQEDDPDYSSERNRSRSFRESYTGDRQGDQSNPENKTITWSWTRSTRDSYVSGRCSDTGKLNCLIRMSVGEGRYKSLTENTWDRLISHSALHRGFSVPDGQCSMADLKPKGPIGSVGPPSGGQAISLTPLFPLYSTGFCCSV